MYSHNISAVQISITTNALYELCMVEDSQVAIVYMWKSRVEIKHYSVAMSIALLGTYYVNGREDTWGVGEGEGGRARGPHSNT